MFLEIYNYSGGIDLIARIYCINAFRFSEKLALLHTHWLAYWCHPRGIYKQYASARHRSAGEVKNSMAHLLFVVAATWRNCQLSKLLGIIMLCPAPHVYMCMCVYISPAHKSRNAPMTSPLSLDGQRHRLTQRVAVFWNYAIGRIRTRCVFIWRYADAHDDSEREILFLSLCVCEEAELNFASLREIGLLPREYI